MPVGRAVQFKGAEAVVGAYEANKVPAFAIAYDKNIFFRYCESNLKEGKDLLCGYLELLEKHDSKAIYTLRLYEGLKGQRIKNNTPYDLSFNFLVAEPDGEESVSGTAVVHSTGNTAQLLSLMKELSKAETERAITDLKYKQLQEAIDNAPESDEKSMGMKFMEELLPVLGQIGSALATKMFGGAPGGQAAMAGATINTGDGYEEQKIADSIHDLKENWNSKHKLGDVLERLALMNREQNEAFSFYLGHLMR